MIFIVLQLQVAHGFNLLANCVGVDTEQIVPAAAELRRNVYIAVAVEDSSLHVQLVGVRGLSSECSTGEVNCVMVRSSVLSLERFHQKPKQKKGGGVYLYYPTLSRSDGRWRRWRSFARPSLIY